MFLSARFKLILGHLQLDNQLPLTVMPVLLAPEMNSDMHYPVLKTTITMRNDNSDGVQVYPYVCIRVMPFYMMPKMYVISRNSEKYLSSDQNL